jgi:hypothetical protein
MPAGLLAIELPVRFDGLNQLANDEMTLLRNQESFA